MTMSRVLLLNGQGDPYWIELLRQAVLSLGKSLALIHHRDLEGVSFQNYELIILDANAIVNPTSMIQTIRSCTPLARIIVMTPAPHWKEARAILLAGAMDYTRKVDDDAAILDILRDNLSNR